MKDKRLIYILNNYSKNSTEHFFHVLYLLEEIASNGVKILLVIEKSDGEPTLRNSNIEVVCLKKVKSARLFELYQVLSRAQKEGYNKIFVRISNWATVVSIIKSFFSKLEVYYWHSGTVFGFDNEQKLNLNKINWFFKTRMPFNFIKKYVTFFVTGPESMRNYYSNVVGVDNKKIKILYNDIDLSRFKILTFEEKREVKRSLSIEEDKRIILFVHNFSPVRKTKMYVENFLKKFFEEKDLQDYRFYFIGGGKDKSEIEQHVIDLKLSKKVYFLGALPNNVVHQYYQIADFFINPTAAEGFPRVLIEGMACGLPIVTTDAGGIKDILGDKQLDFMSDFNNPNLFSNNLIKMAKLSKEEQDILKNENLEVVKKYSTSIVAKMYINTLFDE